MSTTQSTPTSPTTQRVKSVPRVLSSPLRPTSPQSSSTVIPSNSRRPSLGPKSRARDLLRKHYGLGVGPPLPLPGRSDDPMDLDSAAFDAKSYYEQLITASSLSALLKRENDLLTEIRQLDGDRQSLVYNHHHELIAASDTIAAMKTRAEGLDADLDLLKAAFSEISRLGAKVSVEEQPADGSSHP
ncbi:Vps51/Vps67-domain-containing protein [Suillus subalutaceus]|uniref:Vps51/Vps67-domain-containing protein n=1 Tax=Suillus subalutaceus TaxID=48586 RepID=UPI001B8624AE|nr:Vps51/Vps67-domain-containing protein [Suillus subalutaceus]KAG1865438.1 Vps51/Vps67-domain-containing protein [Suillus subalutaceus]